MYWNEIRFVKGRLKFGWIVTLDVLKWPKDKARGTQNKVE